MSSIDPMLHPLTTLMADLSKPEQLHLMKTHPFFTGSCPKCQRQAKQASRAPVSWCCDRCGWKDTCA